MKKQRKWGKRILALFVVLMMCVRMMPSVDAFAAGGYYNGKYYNELSFMSNTYYVGQKVDALATVTKGNLVPYIQENNYSLTVTGTERSNFSGTSNGRSYQKCYNSGRYTGEFYGVAFTGMTLSEPGTVELVVTFQFRWSPWESWQKACFVYNLTFVPLENTEEQMLELKINESEDVISVPANGTNFEVLSYDSSDGSIATVTDPVISGGNVNYTITGQKAGKADIMVTYKGTVDLGSYSLFGNKQSATGVFTDIIHVNVEGDIVTETQYKIVREYYVNGEKIATVSGAAKDGKVGDVITGSKLAEENPEWLNYTSDGKLFSFSYAGSTPESLVLVEDADRNIITLRYEKTELTDPSDPTEPSEPTDPTDPTEPTEPSEPTNPSEPTEPSEPTNPSEPTEPSEPTNPSEPTEPSEPTNPSEPTEPSEPTNPSDPTDPSVPTIPTTPSSPTVPTEPTEPSVPTNPTEPSTPVVPEPTDTPEPEEPVVTPEEPVPTPEVTVTPDPGDENVDIPEDENPLGTPDIPEGPETPEAPETTDPSDETPEETPDNTPDDESDSASDSIDTTPEEIIDITEEETPLGTPDDTPKTGDASRTVLWAVLFLVSIGSMAAMFIPRRKRQ